MGLIFIIAKLLGLKINELALENVDYGDFHYKHGRHEVFVPTKITPDQVFVSMSEHGTDGCANAPRNTISWKKHENGVYFFLNVETDHCKVEWVVIGY